MDKGEFKIILFSLLIAIANYFSLFCFFSFSVRYLLEFLDEEYYEMIILIQPVGYFLTMLLMYVLAKRLFKFNFNGGHKLHIKSLFVFVLISLLFRVFTDFIINFDHIFDNKEFYISPDSNTININFWVQILSSIILVPILEEIVFRGMIFKLMLRKWGIFFSAIFSSLLFSIGHINPSELHFSLPVSSFLFGVILSMVYLKHNLKGVILLHSFYNSLVFILGSNKLLYYEFLDNLKFGLRYWSIVISALIILIFVIKYNILEVPKKNVQ